MQILESQVQRTVKYLPQGQGCSVRPAVVLADTGHTLLPASSQLFTGQVKRVLPGPSCQWRPAGGFCLILASLIIHLKDWGCVAHRSRCLCMCTQVYLRVLVLQAACRGNRTALRFSSQPPIVDCGEQNQIFMFI